MIKNEQRNNSYGQHGSTFIDHIGVYLSKIIIENHLPVNKVRMLDIGCGFHASLLMNLKSRLELGVGIDVKIDDPLKIMGGYIFYEMPFENAIKSLENNYFDIITMISVIEHTWEPLKFLKWGFDLLKPGGKLLVNVPTWAGKNYLEFSAFKLKLSPLYGMDDHKMYYNKENLWPLVVQAGFKPSQISMNYHKFGLNLFSVSRKHELKPEES